MKKYVSHSESEYYDWEHYNHHYPELAYEMDDEYSIRIWEHEKEEYLKKSKDPATKAEAEKIKTKYDESLAKLFHIIEVKSIYLDEKVGNTINDLKKELSTTHDCEDWDEHFFRQSKAVKSTETKLKEISIEELKIKT